MSTQAEPGLTIDFGTLGNSREYLGNGWALAEPDFTWAIGMESEIRVRELPRAGDLLLTLDVVPFVRPPELPSQRLIVSVNGLVLGSSVLRRPTLLGYRIPADALSASGGLAIVLQHPDAARPAEFEVSSDRRMLTFAVSQARIYRSSPVSFVAGLMINGQERPSLGGRRPSDITGWVMARTGLSPRDLAFRFESIGENCEFGLVQRGCDAEPLGLLRFSSIFLRPLIRGLDDRFEGLGNAASIEPRYENDEYMIYEKVYGLVYHSFVREGERDVDRLREQEAIRLKFLRRKFLEELETGGKIFVYKGGATISDEEILPLHLALRRYADNTLLWVVPAERDRPPGSVEMVLPGLLKAYIDRFAPDDNAHDFSFDGWMRVCGNALVLANVGKDEAR